MPFSRLAMTCCHLKTSSSRPRMIHSQSQPSMPAASQTSMYMIVVYGRKMIPSKGMRNSPCQTRAQRSLKNHARSRNSRGATDNPKASKQPSRIIASLLLRAAWYAIRHAERRSRAPDGRARRYPWPRMSALVTAYDIEAVRARFPALHRRVDDQPVAWLDGPAGTQVPDACLDAIHDFLVAGGSNTHGAFAASAETDALVAATRAGVADLLGAREPDEIAFGPNMTTITFALSRAIAASLAAGDEIVLTRMDHDANVAPWLAAARERALVVRWIDVDPDDCTLRLDDLDRIIGPRTRLVAVGFASNAVGTINPIARIAAAARE